MEDNCGSRDFEKTEKEIIERTQDIFELAYRIYWSGLDTLKDAINLLIKESLAAPTELHIKILLLLTNRAIQHVEGVRLLTERGLYGDAFALMRNVMSDLSMMQYLHHHSELRELFWNEKQDDYQKNPAFNKAFNESSIEKDLVGRGATPFMQAFRILSKAHHASAFGSQLYGSEGEKDGQYHFTYGPRLQEKKALMLMDLISSLHYDVLSNILGYQEEKGNGCISEDWKNIENAAIKLEIQVKSYSDASKITLGDIFSKKS